MPSMEVPASRVFLLPELTPKNKMTLAGWAWQKKMLVSYDRSRDVYENKENRDTMAGVKADIFGSLSGNVATF